MQKRNARIVTDIHRELEMDDVMSEGNSVSFINTGRMKPIVKMVVPRRTRFVCSFIGREGRKC